MLVKKRLGTSHKSCGLELVERANPNIRSTVTLITPWICEHIDNAIDAEATEITIQVNRGRYECSDNGTGVTPDKEKPNWEAVLLPHKHDGQGRKNPIGQHGCGGTLASIHLTQVKDGSIINAYTKRKGDKNTLAAYMPVGHIVKENDDIFWEPGDPTKEGCVISGTGTVIRVTSDGKRIEYIKAYMEQFRSVIGEIYYKAIQNGLKIRIVKDPGDSGVVVSQEVDYTGGAPAVSSSFDVEFRKNDSSPLLRGKVKCFFGEASDEMKKRGKDLGKITGIRIVHEKSGRFINAQKGDAKAINFLDIPLPVGLVGEVFLGDVGPVDGSESEDHTWPMSLYKDDVNEDVSDQVGLKITENPQFAQLVKHLEEKNQSLEHQGLNDEVNRLLNNYLPEFMDDLPEDKKEGQSLIYPDRAARDNPGKIKNPGTNSPYKPCPGINSGKVRSPFVNTRICKGLPPEIPLFDISSDDRLITINADLPEFKAVEPVLCIVVAMYYAAFRKGGTNFQRDTIEQHLVNERKQATLGLVRAIAGVIKN